MVVIIILNPKKCRIGAILTDIPLRALNSALIKLHKPNASTL